MQKVLSVISGVPSNEGGAGRFLYCLCAALESEGILVQLVTRRQTRSLRRMIRSHPWRVPGEIVLRFIDAVRFSLCSSITATRAADLILFHPQSIGWRRTEKIVATRPFTWIFALDNSHFCARAYNNIEGELRPCLRCSGTDKRPAVTMGCISHFQIEEYSSAIAAIAGFAASRKVGFLAQNSGQERLLRNAAANDIICHVLGLIVDDVDPHSLLEMVPPKRDFVFHGAASWVKGLGVVFELSHRMPGRSFLVPTDRKLLTGFAAKVAWPTNVQFQSMTWETGLKQALCSSRIVLCPSVWSAPIEGAVIKSLAWNGAVGVVESANHFANEIPQSAKISIDPENWDSTVDKLESYCRDSKALSELRCAGRTFAKSLIEGNSTLAKKLLRVIRNCPSRLGGE